MKTIAFVFALLASPAMAQDQQAVTARIASQVGTLIIHNASQAQQIEELQAALDAAKARVKALEDKYEPKESPAK